MSNDELDKICAVCQYNSSRTAAELMQQQIENQRRRLQAAKEFFIKVKQMRTAQINYFKTRASGYLDESKKLESDVDKIIEYATTKAKQLNINF